ncbi:hypothetical protein ACE1BS_22170 [Aeromonas jandaei]
MTHLIEVVLIGCRGLQAVRQATFGLDTDMGLHTELLCKANDCHAFFTNVWVYHPLFLQHFEDKFYKNPVKKRNNCSICERPHNKSDHGSFERRPKGRDSADPRQRRVASW